MPQPLAATLLAASIVGALWMATGGVLETSMARTTQDGDRAFETATFALG